MAETSAAVKVRLIGIPQEIQSILGFLGMSRSIVHQSEVLPSRKSATERLQYVMLKVGFGVPCLLCGEIGDWLAHNEQYVCHSCRFEVW